MAAPSAGYNFNNFFEIKSHSSILYNERMAILFYDLDRVGIRINKFPELNDVLEFKGILTQIYSNVRTLIRNNPVMRMYMKLDTKDEGIYITDVGFGIIERMIEWCETNSYSQKRLYIIKNELVHLERIIKDVLQFYHYFIRPDFRQKPDIDVAALKYKEIADERTIEELKQLVGKNHKIDFEALGNSDIKIGEIGFGGGIEEEKEEENLDEDDDIGSTAESDGTYDSVEDSGDAGWDK